MIIISLKLAIESEGFSQTRKKTIHVNLNSNIWQIWLKTSKYIDTLYIEE